MKKHEWTTYTFVGKDGKCAIFGVYSKCQICTLVITRGQEDKAIECLGRRPTPQEKESFSSKWKEKTGMENKLKTIYGVSEIYETKQ